ncbi:MAG TPA: undecaprenyl-diphosphate phosphatase [Candidatus Polarisedimenticolaceae bacterium]|nr:undecaprenyl-diphosphate phosphatase [Candidatus Polarisedimenticolaceae bacterium]
MLSPLIDAVILGIVEGLTEFLPVSSTGHLIVMGHVLGFTGAKAATFEVFIQLGAILAVVWLFRDRFVSLLSLKPASSGLAGRRGVGLLALTTLPALIFGFLLHDFIKTSLFTPLTVALALGIGGVAIILFERFYKPAKANTLDTITVRQALAIGLFQVLALWPGVSRAAATILGGMFSGLDRKAAVEYSFLAAVPVMLAATGYDLLKSLPFLHIGDLPLFAVGFITSFIAAVVAIKWLVKLVQTHNFAAFGWYRIALAIIIVLVLL